MMQKRMILGVLLLSLSACGIESDSDYDNSENSSNTTKTDNGNTSTSSNNTNTNTNTNNNSSDNSDSFSLLDLFSNDDDCSASDKNSLCYLSPVGVKCNVLLKTSPSLYNKGYIDVILYKGNVEDGQKVDSLHIVGGSFYTYSRECGNVEFLSAKAIYPQDAQSQKIMSVVDGGDFKAESKQICGKDCYVPTQITDFDLEKP